MLIASLRDVIRQQSIEIDTLEKRLKESSHTRVSHLKITNYLIVTDNT